MKKIPKSLRIALGFVYIIVGVVLLYSLTISFIGIMEHQNTISKLEKEKQEVVAEKKSLQKEVELLESDDYLTRYARENYIFTRDGENVTTIPGKK